MKRITGFVAANGGRNDRLLYFGTVPLTAAAVTEAVLLGSVLSSFPGYYLDYMGKLGVGLVRRAVEDRERLRIGGGWRIPLERV